MKLKEIKGQYRKKFGSTDANKHRKKGLIPCVLYGGGHKNIHFYAFINDFKELVYTPEAYEVNIHISRKKYEAILQNVQFHPLSDEIIHVDFYEVSKDKEVRTTLPVSLVGTPEGTKEGGRFYQKTRKLRIRGKIKDIPDKLEIDVTPMQMNENIKVEDLNLPDLEVLNAPTVNIASVLPPKGLLVTEEEAAEAEEAEEEGAEEVEGAEESKEGEERTSEEKEKEGEES